jgi:hypothetical protein
LNNNNIINSSSNNSNNYSTVLAILLLYIRSLFFLLDYLDFLVLQDWQLIETFSQEVCSQLVRMCQETNQLSGSVEPSPANPVSSST